MGAAAGGAPPPEHAALVRGGGVSARGEAAKARPRGRRRGWRGEKKPKGVATQPRGSTPSALESAQARPISQPVRETRVRAVCRLRILAFALANATYRGNGRQAEEAQPNAVGLGVARAELSLVVAKRQYQLANTQ